MYTEGCSYFRSNILFVFTRVGLFFARRPQHWGTGGTVPTVFNRERVREGHASRDVPGASPRAGRAALAGEVPSHLRWTAGTPRRSRGSAAPLCEMAAGGRHFPPLRAPRPARLGPALPCPLGGGAAAAAALFLLPGERPAPASPSSASAVQAASLPPSPRPSPGRSLLRRQRRCPPAPWRRSPSPRR